MTLLLLPINYIKSLNDIFLKYWKLKRDSCYHAMAIDMSARNNEIINISIKDKIGREQVWNKVKRLNIVWSIMLEKKK